MRLKYQLFLTLLAVSAVLIALMYIISSYSFSRSFLAYINDNELERMQPVAEQLVELYEADGSWDGVTLDTMRSIQADASNARRSPRSQKGPVAGGKPTESPRGRVRGKPNRPLGVPLLLTDANKNVIAGQVRSDGDMIWKTLESSERVVGHLGFARIGRVDRQFDQVFEQRRKKTLGLTALAMVLFSGLLAVPLAGRIVRPLLTVNKAVGEISGGDYTQKVDINRRDEIGDLADNINTLGDSLEQNRHARRRWIAEISHELRTPLAVLRGEIEAVQDGVRVIDKDAVESLHGEVLRLNRLIDDLHTLSVSDVGALDYQMQRVNLGELITDFLDSHSNLLSENNLRLTNNIPSGEFPVRADSQRIEQMLTNFLQNSCRYTDAGGELEVRLTQCEEGNRPFLVVDWFDSSPGVSDESLPKLFDPLYRTEISRNRELGGTGLGLAIAKRIVEAHQGDIVAMQSSLGGLHIQFTLPLSARTA